MLKRCFSKFTSSSVNIFSTHPYYLSHFPYYSFSKNRRNDEFRKKLEEEREEITIKLSDIKIPREKVETNFSRSSGPGGQNVNKLNTKAEIRFHVGSCDWLEDDVKERLKSKFFNHINNDGELIITCQTSRTQSRNLEEAFDKLQEMVYQASIPERERKNEIPAETHYETRRRVEDKRKRSDVKKIRSGNFDW